MMELIKLITGIFSGKAGESVGGAVSMAAQLAALVAVIAPIGLWLNNNKEQVFIQLTYGDLAFWGVLLGVQLLLVIRLVHRAPPPQ